MNNKRVLVAGAGAVGSVFGGFLQRAGHSVTLLGRAPHVEAIARDGLVIDGLWGEHRVRGFQIASTASALPGSFDLILVPVKSYDTATMATAVAPLLGPGGTMISLQNGLGNIETLESIVGPERALGARVMFGAAIPEWGCVRVTVFADPTAIGARRPGMHPSRDAAARWWAEAIDTAGVPAIYTERLEAMLWAKVFYSAALNPLGALLGAHYGSLPEHPDSRVLMDTAIEEAFAVAKAEGVELPWATADAYRQEFYDRLVPATYDHRSSMLQDIERGRRTEVDAISGEVSRRGARHGIKTPVNEMLTRLVRLTERQKAESAGTPHVRFP